MDQDALAKQIGYLVLNLWRKDIECEELKKTLEALTPKPPPPVDEGA